MAATEQISTLAQLVARSCQLGADRTICNWGGGNTSAKADEIDFQGRSRRILWVKGSGSDLATVTEKSFTGLYLDDIVPLVEREKMSDTEMVAYLAHCYYDPSRPRPSIETLLHGFLPYTHIDHTHADATNYFACASNGEQLARECFGDALIWIPYRRPGHGLAREVALALRAKPAAGLIILAKHGLITWGDSDAECYASTLATIGQAREFVEARIHAADKTVFGGVHVPAQDQAMRREIAAQIAPTLRGLLSQQGRMVLKYVDTDDVLEFVGSNDAARLTTIGAACPDHLVHTKPWPLLIDWKSDQEQDITTLQDTLRGAVAGYVTKYERYLEENAGQDLDPDGNEPVYRAADAVTNPMPRVILVPGVGMFTSGKDAGAADVAAQLYHRAIAVMRGAEACGGFISLTDAESYAVEYWPLEQYKLKLAPPEREFARTIALVTGAAGGIGSAICRRLAQDGAHIVATDIDLAGAERLAEELNKRFGTGRAKAVAMNVTSESEVKAAFGEAARVFGGLDIIVNNAGLASSAPITETSLDLWNKNISVLATGYFLVAREAFQLLVQQGIGGNMVFVSSKNGLVAGKNVAAYSTAKSAEIHLARCLAEEGGAYKIRVNTVNPDAVISGSRIWNSSWRQERASSYGIGDDQLEEHYRKRTTLGVSILPEDISEAVAFFASPTRAIKSTGNILNVDGGVAAAYTR
jgi:rhamnulose-1-phosphate aldolase/alcohol dehydrogenase